MKAGKQRRCGHGNRRGTVRIPMLLFMTAAAAFFISGLLCTERAGAQTPGCSITLTPSAPAVDNGLPNVYGCYNLESEVSVYVRVEADAEGAGIAKIACRITDGTKEAGAPADTQLLYEDTYAEPEEPVEPEDPAEPVEPTEPEEPEDPGEPGEPEEPAETEDPGEPEDPDEEEGGDDEDIPPKEETETHRALYLWEGSVDIDTSLWNTGEVTVLVWAADFTGIESESSVQLDIDTVRPEISVSYDNNVSSGVDAAGNVCFNAPAGEDGAASAAVRTAKVVIRERSDHFSAEKAAKGISVTASDPDGSRRVTASDARLSDWVTERGSTPDGDIHTATIEFFGDAVYTLAVSYTDEAGNGNDGVDAGTSLAPWQFAVDTTAPAVTVSYDNNTPFSSSCYGSARTATIGVSERNFDPDGVSLTVTNPEGNVPALSGWKRSSGAGTTKETGTDPVYTATLAFEEDGDYTFAISCTDLAGNRSETVSFREGTADGEAFVIDRTNPRVSVSYDNDQVSGDHYFNGPRVATVVITEHNFDVGLVDFSRSFTSDGDDDVVISTAWSHDGDVHTATLLFAADGDYTFDVSVTDMAGNDSGEADFGDSQAPRAFTVDTSPPEAMIVGVRDGQCCPGAVSPGISARDSNFSGCEISLTRTRLDEADADVTELFFPERELDGQGGEVFCRTIEEVRDNDGIYTLRVAASDLAGNESEASARFFVDRFGSVYVFGDYLISLIRDGGSCVREVGEDLVITEYNPTRLVADSLFIDVTRDGKPVADLNCRLSALPGTDVPPGSRGWYEYRYTISRDNFAQDGVYKMSLSSEDEAGNTSDNLRAAGTDMIFWVDSTAPEVSGSAKTDDGGFLLKGENFEYTAYDTIGLKSLEVYLNGEAAGEPLTDFGRDINRFSGSMAIGVSESEQEVRLVATDLAGNAAEICCTVPAGPHTIAERIDFPRTALEQMSARNIMIPVVEGAAAAAAVILILLLVKRKFDPRDHSGSG